MNDVLVLQAPDFLAALLACMPRGKIWPKDADAVQTQVLLGLATPFQQHNDRANYLLVDAFPATADELLPQWEATLGLPDPCAGESPTLQARRQQVVARLTNSGGQSAAYFIAYAQSLGFEVTITQFTPFRMGQQRMGCPLGTQDWAFAWRVDAPANTITYFSLGQSAVGEPLAVWGSDVLECELRRLIPANTVLTFAYGTPGALDSTFVLGESSLS
ncbi:YmfQ family protein [Paraburkholderia silviterrae]|uniref:DUF2313 domain-containing protein n=1 Tax=Paraburkholderia silviterrae TaxID=2528715 RepID=A0A4R5MA38_9BURK|nr:putative phage tail protein [Paraburkholderia silviterrae]TDG23211.1 DUF2313 domain-containing protein [Paraburkholderia silviterrae]